MAARCGRGAALARQGARARCLSSACTGPRCAATRPPRHRSRSAGGAGRAPATRATPALVLPSALQGLTHAVDDFAGLSSFLSDRVVGVRAVAQHQGVLDAGAAPHVGALSQHAVADLAAHQHCGGRGCRGCMEGVTGVHGTAEGHGGCRKAGCHGPQACAAWRGSPPAAPPGAQGSDFSNLRHGSCEWQPAGCVSGMRVAPTPLSPSQRAQDGGAGPNHSHHHHQPQNSNNINNSNNRPPGLPRWVPREAPTRAVADDHAVEVGAVHGGGGQAGALAPRHVVHLQAGQSGRQGRE